MNNQNTQTRRAGYRYFFCNDCGENWTETTRDFLSPSADACPVCCNLCAPRGGNADPGLAVDKYGNLI